MIIAFGHLLNNGAEAISVHLQENHGFKIVDIGRAIYGEINKAKILVKISNPQVAQIIINGFNERVPIDSGFVEFIKNKGDRQGPYYVFDSVFHGFPDYLLYWWRYSFRCSQNSCYTRKYLEKNIPDPSEDVVIPDIILPEEANFVAQNGGNLFKIDLPSLETIHPAQNLLSEYDFNEYFINENSQALIRNVMGSLIQKGIINEQIRWKGEYSRAIDSSTEETTVSTEAERDQTAGGPGVKSRTRRKKTKSSLLG